MKTRAASPSDSLSTRPSRAPTTYTGIGLASFRVFARSATTFSWRARNLRSSRLGRSITNLAATHFKLVLKDGITVGPQNLESRWRAYFRIFSTVSGKASISENAAQCSNLSTARTCAIIVRGAPELSTSFLSLAASPGSSSSQDSCSLSSLANWPALFPIDSSLPAHFTLIAFSWSRSGVDEFPSSPLSALNFLLGWMTFFTSGATVANLLRLATDPSVSSARAPSQSPNPSWKHVDWRKTFSAEIANLQKCSRAVGCGTQNSRDFLLPATRPFSN